MARRGVSVFTFKLLASPFAFTLTLFFSISLFFAHNPRYSPIAISKTVVLTKSVEYMPFLLSFFLFLNGATWTLYAVLQQDIYLMVPNGIGCFLGAVQLVLYAIYMNAKPLKSDLSENLIDEDSQQETHSSSSSQLPKKDFI